MAREIFLIDDDAEALGFFCDALKEIDPSRTCRDFKSCMEVLRYFDLGIQLLTMCFFVDLSMPKMDGWECLKAIKAINQLRDIPLFIISGHLPEETRFKLTSLGAAGFVTKPESFQKLRNEISALLTNYFDGAKL